MAVRRYAPMTRRSSPSFWRTWSEFKQIPDIEVQIINHYDIHASNADNLFERAERLANRQPGDPHPWVAPDDFQNWLDEVIADTQERLVAAQ